MGNNTSKKDFRALAVVANIWRNYSFIFIFVIIVIGYIITINTTGKSFNWGHISAILASQNTVIVGTMALGMALVIITGQIDLSVGSGLVLCSGVTAIAFNATNSIPLTILAALFAGFVCGAINGIFVGIAHMPPFIVTLGTMLIYRSISLYFVRQIPPELTGSSSSQFSMSSEDAAGNAIPQYETLRMQFGTGSLDLGIISIPYITFLFIALVILFVIISKNTKYGKSVYATGSNEKAAHLAGINTQWVKISVFIITGLMMGVAALIQISKIGSVTPAQTGMSYEMYAIAAVVLGGINMAGGRGNMLGVLFGALSYTAISFIIQSIPVFTPDIQNTFQGIVLILVILVQTAGPALRERFSRRRSVRKPDKAVTE
ncbi:MAG: ABC transporter permease [Clostridiales Family XIII bacterium]|nr:ABC transporter permease [Clostridiales Family XIII bacterium]